MRNKRILLYACTLTLLLLIVFTVGPVKKLFKINRKPNILFISLDALRADHLGCYGYPRDTSKNINDLSEQGTLFLQAISQSPRTPQSICSILTSLYPDHSIIEEGYSLSPQAFHLIDILKKYGYATALFSSAEPILSLTLNGIKNSFDIFHIKELKPDGIIQLACDWLTKNHKKPFFLWIHLFDPHGPYTSAPMDYETFLNDNLYPEKYVPIAPNDGEKNDHYSFKFIPRVVAENYITDTRYYIAKYDGEIKFADAQIGILLDRLKSLKLESNTLIVLFSDHGESMTEHNFYFNHSHFVYEPLIRVPLLFVYPDKIPKGKILQQVQLIDVMPTVLNYIGIKNNLPLEGKSLTSLIMGKTDQGALYAFSESPYYPSPQSIRTKDWKLIYYRKLKLYKLYNIKDDPEELNNLILQRPSEARLLKKQLKKWLARAKTHPIVNADISKNNMEKLKSLGYVQ